MATKGKAKCVDDTMRTLISRIQKCDIAAIGVLADWMEENKRPYASKIRCIWNDLQSSLEYWSIPDRDLTRCELTRWELIAGARRWARRRVAKAFGKKWVSTPLSKFKSGANS